MGIELMLGIAGDSSGSASAPPPPPHLNVGEMWAQQRSGDARKQCVSCLLNIEMGARGAVKWGARGADRSPGVHHQDGGFAREQALMWFLDHYSCPW